MRKSVYSIVLSDDVISHIDRLAYAQGKSRSNMINQILAEYVSYVTPEKRLSDIFSRAMEMIAATDQLQVMLRPSETMLSIKSALSYKYNPTVRYSVELYKSGADLGELRVVLRTQSAGLIGLMNDFYALWNGVEQSVLGYAPQCSLSGEKYVRRLKKPGGDSGEALAEAIVTYIQTIDKAMKGYFSDVNCGKAPEDGVVQTYLQYQKDNLLLL